MKKTSKYYVNQVKRSGQIKKNPRYFAGLSLIQPARFKQQQNIQSYRFNLPNPFSMIISLLVCKSITPSWKEVFSYTLISTQWFPTSSPLLSCSILYPESLPSRGGPSKPILLRFRFGSSTSRESERSFCLRQMEILANTHV